MELQNTKYDSMSELGAHDVICGRGTKANNNKGNILFRDLVKQYKIKYVDASKIDKPKVAREVVKIWRSQLPPGRFLSKKEKEDKSKETWFDIGDNKAREKASQCLRERTPDIIPYIEKFGKKKNYRKKSNVRQKTPPSICNANDTKNSSPLNNNDNQQHTLKPSAQRDRLRNAMLNSINSMNCSLLPNGLHSSLLRVPITVNDIANPHGSFRSYSTPIVNRDNISLPNALFSFAKPNVEINNFNPSMDPINMSMNILRKLEYSLKSLQQKQEQS